MENYVEKKESFEDLIKRIKELQKSNDSTLQGGYIALPKPNEAEENDGLLNIGCTIRNDGCKRI